MTSEASLSVSELLTRAQQAIVGAFPGPVWVRGEVIGFRRTAGGAAFFRLADPDVDDASLDVSGRGRVMLEVDRVLGDSGLGALRDGIEIRVKGTVGVEAGRSILRLSLLEVDPTFTAGRLALDRAEVIRKMTADGTLQANGRLPLPLVPLRLGLVTSRGSAAHADFLDHLRRSGFRFSVLTAHTSVQGEAAPDRLAAAIRRLAEEQLDVIAVIRGGGSKLDMAAFDTEPVARAVAAAGAPVITGIGHEIDRTVTDEAAARSLKTPTAAAEWLVGRVADFAGRLDRARAHIRIEARAMLGRHRHLLHRTASDIAGVSGALARQSDLLGVVRREITISARRGVEQEKARLDGLSDWFSVIGVDTTLRRGFALVTGDDGRAIVRSVSQVQVGDGLQIRLSDGTVRVTVTQR